MRVLPGRGYEVPIALLLGISACSSNSTPEETSVVVVPATTDAGGAGRSSGNEAPSAPEFVVDEPNVGGDGDSSSESTPDDDVISPCGNGVRNEGEQCDDGNLDSGDGCNGQCNLEPNFECSAAGQACESTIACGDGQIGGAETCDDGNATSGDGCSASCLVEADFGCSNDEGDASRCEPIERAVCGDGLVSDGEQCDDDGTTPGDGCSDVCEIETDFACPTAGQPCEPIEFCSDGFLREGVEDCDDGNLLPFDGCRPDCTLEPNFECTTPGEACRSTVRCGDGIISAPFEVCDDGPLPEGQAPVDGDGCSAGCRVLEPGFSCTGGGDAVVPGPCEPVAEERCGDSALAATEVCDDGNVINGDGCSATCQVELGFDCVHLTQLGPDDPPSRAGCRPVAVCGDGTVNEELGEQCDDDDQRSCQGGDSAGEACEGDAECPLGSCEPQGGDGCSSNCFVEANFSCPVAGQPCVSTVVCGNGVVEGDETCDVPGVGCDDCQTEVGFVCAGGVCLTSCGDGIRAGVEQCDDGGSEAGDGCGPNCLLEDGFACDDPVAPPEATDECRPTTCGDGLQEGTEQCDDTLPGEADAPYDGCFACVSEIQCGDFGDGYACPEVCGDGLTFPAEECDDGNAIAGDGCSADCELERGFVCEDEAASLGATLELPVIYRDFSETHPQFEINPEGGVLLPGIAAPELGADGRPVYDEGFASLASTPTCNGDARPRTLDAPIGSDDPPAGGTPACLAPTFVDAAEVAAAFAEWYRDDPSNVAVFDLLQLAETAPGSGVFECSDGACFGSTSDQFFPLDGIGFGNEGRDNNFHFTSEARQAFVFDPDNPPTLTFRGDDDVWVYVNGQLTVDLGGIHGERTGRIFVNGPASELCIGPNGEDVDDFDADPAGFCQTLDLALDPSRVNEIAVFQAERHVVASNYTLALEGFDAPITRCAPVCGDGIVTAGEACDCGTAGDADTLNDNCNAGAGNQPPGTYDACDENCQLGPFCGDNVVQAAEGEDCDNGLNTSVRLLADTDCGAGCRTPSFCGDGNLDGAFGEECDCGDASNPSSLNPDCGGADNQAPGTYDACDTNCRLGPSCGDGVLQPSEGEECDDAENNGSAGSDCLSDCRLRCGNGEIDQGEQCDDGLAQNLGGYETCNADCTLAPRCGDGVTDPAFGEICDDGLNNGDYQTCAPGCVPGPFCGDGEPDEDFGEQCDPGLSNLVPLNTYAGSDPNLCTLRCAPAPFCGDSQVDVGFGEGCDDGINDGTPGSCETDCSAFVPLPACGDANVDPGERCDDGPRNGNVNSSCDVRCQIKCGNGFVDQGEQCDDGVNSGGYGTCNPDCTFAGLCGDGIVQANEGCDDGPANVDVATAYGDGICTALCTRAPTCGDGRLDLVPEIPVLEECDSTPGCTNLCRLIR